MPELKSVGKTLTAAQLTHIINHGLGESANPTKPYMPVWGAVISKRQVDELVAYLHSGLPASRTRPRRRCRATRARKWRAPRSTCVTAASTAMARTASAACRTRSQRTRRSRLSREPTSAASSNTDQKITDVIRSGSVIGRAPIVSMPHWGGILSDADLQALVTYIKTFK